MRTHTSRHDNLFQKPFETAVRLSKSRLDISNGSARFVFITQMKGEKNLRLVFHGNVEQTMTAPVRL